MYFCGSVSFQYQLGMITHSWCTELSQSRVTRECTTLLRETVAFLNSSATLTRNCNHRPEQVCHAKAAIAVVIYPFYLVWLACTLSFILGLPSLGSTVAYAAATSIATIGLYLSYGLFILHCHHHMYSIHPSGIPIMLRVVNRKEFVRGPFHLGKFSYPVALIAVTWISFIAIAFILPQVNVSPGLSSI